MGDKWIFWLNEVGVEHNNLVGKKCANLGELTKGGFRVPPGCALSVDAYARFMEESGARADLLKFLSSFQADPDSIADTLKFEKASEEMRGIVESKKMPSDMEQTVKEYYDGLCKQMKTDELPVATRSAGPVSHPGQYETYLHVRGADDVVRNVIRVWSSTCNARSVIARARLGFPLEYDPIGVAILTMVDARSAGVMFSLNPTNGDESKVTIEGGWGLGEAVVSGSINPDRFLVDKVMLEIEERVTSHKNLEFAYNPEKREMEYRDLPADLMDRPCLEDKEVIELCRTAKRLEAYFKSPRDSEWCVARGLPFPENIFLVQTRPESVWSKKKKEPLLGQKSGWELLLEKATTPLKVKI